MLKHLLFILLLAGGSYYYWTTRPVIHGPGIVAPNEPTQNKVIHVRPIRHDSFKLTPLAEFEFEARVLSKKRYNDSKAELIPYDIVFGWGPMSDERNLESILVKQSDRSYYWEMAKPPIPQKEMWTNSANMHLIPSNIHLRDSLGDIRRGHILNVKGYLVNVSSPDGWKMETSLSRDDIGHSSSEVVWVEELTIR